MKLWIKVGIGVLSGFGAGFATGFLFHKKLNDVEFEEISEEEMAKIEANVNGKTVTKKEAAHEMTEAEASSLARVNSVEELPKDPDELKKALQGKVSYLKADQEEKEKYAKIWGAVKDYSNEENADNLPVQQHSEEEEFTDSPSDVEEGFDEQFLEVIEQEEVEPGQVEPPHAISLNEFYNERPEYDKISLDWYEKGPNDTGIGTFVDDRGEIIASIETYVGDVDLVKLFNEETDGEPDVRFIRNESYGSDYEIVRHHMTLQEYMGGRF